MVDPASASGQRNWLLRALPAAELAVLTPHFEQVTLHAGDVLQVTGERIAHVYFPEDGVVSYISQLDEGASFEVGSVGKGGILGTVAMRPEPGALLDWLCLINGDAVRLPSDRFREALVSCPRLTAQAERFHDLMYAVSVRSAACIAGHDVDHRLARWLLTAADWLEGPKFEVTHGHMARALGVSRPSLSMSAHALRKAGVIEYSRGHVRIADRAALEGRACSCLPALRRRFVRFFAEYARP